MRERLSSLLFMLLLSSVASVSSVVELRAQGQPPAQQPVPPAPKRRALEIHGQAPAPEVVTVRPREIPQYTRRVITPLFTGGSAPKKSSTVVVLPAPLPEPRAGQPNQSQKPE
ncbi:MAG: hypothetical protein HY084_10645 [Gemmatimonadetes bacterium]|nr:hypothetical protein [Gemmatimonadota bacterium]